MTRHENLFRPMFEYALQGESPITKSYHSDLGWDAIGLSRSGAGDIFVWAPYEYGTHRFLVLGDGKFLRGDWERAIRACSSVEPKDWHVGEIEAMSNNCMASGRLERPGFDTTEEFIAYVQDLIIATRAKTAAEDVA